PPPWGRTYPSSARVSRIRRAVGLASPVAVATSVNDITGCRGWKAVMTSRPRASASMKSGPVPSRGMVAPLDVFECTVHASACRTVHRRHSTQGRKAPVSVVRRQWLPSDRGADSIHQNGVEFGVHAVLTALGGLITIRQQQVAVIRTSVRHRVGDSVMS